MSILFFTFCLHTNIIDYNICLFCEHVVIGMANDKVGDNVKCLGATLKYRTSEEEDKDKLSKYLRRNHI